MNKDEKVIIISFGQFHSFNLAYQLQDRNLLKYIFCSYPFFKAKKYGIQKKKYFSFFFFFIIERVFKFKVTSKIIFSLILKIYLRNIRNHTIIIWSSIPSFLVKTLKQNENKIIIERGSSHINFQEKIILEEYNKFNLNYIINKKNIKNENTNYYLADYISIPSKFVEESFIKNNISKDKLFLNPYGCDLNWFYNKAKKNRKFIILTVGSFSVRKGYQYLIKSLQMLNFDYKHLHVGSIQTPTPEEFKKYFSTKNFTYTKSVPKEKLVDFYNKASVFILPTIEDGFGMVILEALACNIPIIATENSGFSTINNYNDYGILIKPFSSFELTKAINDIKFNNSDLNFQFDKKEIVANFSWESYGKRYYDFIINI